MEEVGDDGKVTATLNNDKTKAVLERLKAMRWEDNSMGSTFDYAWGTINQAFAAGQVGMFTGGSDLYTWMIQNAASSRRTTASPTIPLDGERRRRPRRRDPRCGQRRDHRGRARRGRQVDRLLLHPEAATEEGAIADAEALTANNQPVGVPALPIFDKATYDESQVWIKDYINVPTDQMTTFTAKIFDQPLVNEPVAHTQELYAALDPVVQAVLTDQNADINALLDAANAQVQAILDAG